MTEGPYYVDEGLDRSDIRSDPANGALSQGALLALTFKVSRISDQGCAPLEGARVDVWHCDAAGRYSDVADALSDTRGQKFLRGHQLTDAGGRATFLTIYPGWYPGRTVHIHFKVYAEASGQGREFTSQLFFDDAFTDQVLAQAPYAARGPRSTFNRNDGIYDERLQLDVSAADAGYAAAFDIGLQLD
jgi:protocatechuate 3,4-dioxygenase beta subunit